MKNRRNSNNYTESSFVFLTYLFLLCIIILATVAILFGGLFNYLGNSPPEEETTKCEQTIEYEASQSPSDVPTIESSNILENPNVPEESTTRNSDFYEETTEGSNTDSNEQTEFIEETTQSSDTNSNEPTETIEETTQNSDTSPSEPTETTTPQQTTPKEPKGTIYLTFDDGPSTKITPHILDILKEKNVKATFFVVGYSYGSEKEKLIIREFQEGHTVALHGVSHEYSKIYSSLEALIQNFTALQEKVKNSTGYTPTIIRFPGGSSNTVSKHYCDGIMSDAVKYFSDSEFVYFDWNIDSQDAGGAKSSQEVYENVIRTLKPGKNNVVLMHDSSSKQYTLDALEAIIDFCIAEGYEFKAITSDTPQIVHKVSN